MSNLRKVVYARLHTTVMIVGIGQLGGSKEIRPTAPTPGKQGFELYKHPEGLLVKNNISEVLIPMANVQMIALALEEAPVLHVAASSGITKDMTKK